MLRLHTSALRLASFIGLLLVTGIALRPAQAQVTIAPIVVHLSEHNRYGAATVVNESPRAQEVAFTFTFTYPATDSLGHPARPDLRPDLVAQHSLEDWVQVFPRKFVLAPGQRQRVRFAIRPPADLDDGMYWTRLVMTSQPQDFLATSANAAAQSIQSGIRVQVVHESPILFSKGEVHTDLRMTPLQVQPTDEGLAVHTRYTRSGNAPFFGEVTLALETEDGRSVRTTTAQAIAVYDSIVRGHLLDTTGVDAGTYVLRLSASPERSDLPAEAVVGTSPIEQTWTVTL